MSDFNKDDPSKWRPTSKGILVPNTPQNETEHNVFKHRNKKMAVVFHARIYTEYCGDDGFLVMDRRCHALFHYAITAMQNYKEETETIKPEDTTAFDNSSGYNYFELWKSVAKMYDVSPNEMANFWNLVDEQFDALGLTKVPRIAKYRRPDTNNSVLRA